VVPATSQFSLETPMGGGNKKVPTSKGGGRQFVPHYTRRVFDHEININMPPRKRIKEASTTHAVKEPASMFFASHRPEALHTPEAWKLSEDAMGGGKSEVTRAIVSLHLRTADSPMMQLKSDLCLLVLVKLTPSTHEIQLHDNEKVLVVQPLLPSLVFAFNTVSDSFKLIM
jgi:hypothetical protein